MSLRYRYLGHTGLRVSELCLGTMTFGREIPESESHQILNAFVEAGGNFIDSANVYAHGASEEILGRWLQKAKRDDLVVATKVRFATGPGPNEGGLSRKHILVSVHESLRRLRTEYIDLYQVHAWDPKTPLEETLSTLSDLVHQGLVRYIGASNFRGWQLQTALNLCRQAGWEPFRCLQPQYNLLTRAPEWEVFPVCRNQDIGVIPWSPLKGGWLTGKYQRGMAALPAGSRIAQMAERRHEPWQNLISDQTWDIVDTVRAVAEEVGKSSAQVALNWILQQPGVTAPIIGVRNLDQLRDNLGSSGWALDAAQLHRLNEISRIEVGYPYDDAAERQQQVGR